MAKRVLVKITHRGVAWVFPITNVLEISSRIYFNILLMSKNWLLKHLPNLANMPKQKYLCQPSPQIYARWQNWTATQWITTKAPVFAKQDSIAPQEGSHNNFLRDNMLPSGIPEFSSQVAASSVKTSATNLVNSTASFLGHYLLRSNCTRTNNWVAWVKHNFVYLQVRCRPRPSWISTGPLNKA